MALTFPCSLSPSNAEFFHQAGSALPKFSSLTLTLDIWSPNPHFGKTKEKTFRSVNQATTKAIKQFIATSINPPVNPLWY